MGIYKRLEDVPPEFRFVAFAISYRGDDVWEEYKRYYFSRRGASQSKADRCRRAFDKWTSHMQSTERHFALALPQDVNDWAVFLLQEYSESYAESTWSQILRFYRWLMHHPNHPHRYNPFWMAADQYPESRQLWEYRMEDARSRAK